MTTQGHHPPIAWYTRRQPPSLGWRRVPSPDTREKLCTDPVARGLHRVSSTPKAPEARPNSNHDNTLPLPHPYANHLPFCTLSQVNRR